MAANKAQGRSLGLFLVGMTTAGAGLGLMSGGMGTVVMIIGLVLMAMSLWIAFQIKPLEGKVALGAQPAVAKLGGVVVVLVGWAVVLLGLHLTPSVGGRMVASLVGLAIILAGICFVIPAACNKNAIWKA
jgi:hypothetical protein